MTDIVWKDPPPAQNGGNQAGKWAAIRAQLMERPGVWALVASNASAGMAPWQPRRAGFEVTTRSAGTNPPRFDVYMRYVGGDDD